MNRPELKREIKRKLEENNIYLYTKDIDFIVDEVFNTIMEEVSEGREVNINCFGKFSTTEVKRYYGRNPQNIYEVIPIPAHKRIQFNSGKTFKNRVNEK